MSVWHFIIPFYYGANQFVHKKGGAPLQRKCNYLHQTIASIHKLHVNTQITVFTCNDQSTQAAKQISNNVRQIDCPPKNLPFETVRQFQCWFVKQGEDEDIVAFTEDDQVLYVAEPVKNDIQNSSETVVFSPHRWAKQFFFFRAHKRPVFYLNGHRGLLDNFDAAMTGKRFKYNYCYQAQTSRDKAYAACWFMKGAVFRTVDLHCNNDSLCLESASFAVFDSGLPVIKLSGDKKQILSDFIVDHLSGYDYNKRIIKL